MLGKEFLCFLGGFLIVGVLGGAVTLFAAILLLLMCKYLIIGLGLV